MVDNVRGSRRWLHQPQAVGWRNALYQVHLWLGIATGLYVIMISVSGSAVVFRRELGRWLLPPGTDYSDGLPVAIRVMEWLVDLHDNLLAGGTGRDINGVAAILIIGLLVTGAVIWWPGTRHWRRSLIVPRPSRTRRFSWHLHSALGFWSFAILFIWAVTGIYFAFPEPFEALIEFLDPTPGDFERPGDALLLALIRLHFGRFGGLSIRVLWVILGLLPAVLFSTGFIVWWKRIRQRRGSADISPAV